MLSALTINCTLKRSNPAEPSSTAPLLGEVESEWRTMGLRVSSLRAADLSLLPGVTSDEGPGDEWPPSGARSCPPTSSCSGRRSGSASRRQAMASKNYVDLDSTPETTAGTTRTLARLTAHLAGLLKASAYPSTKA